VCSGGTLSSWWWLTVVESVETVRGKAGLEDDAIGSQRTIE
jgi:hypothetical protein